MLNKSMSLENKLFNNNLLINKNKPIVYIPGLGGSVIYDIHNNEIWPPNLYSIVTNNFQKKISITNNLEPIYKTNSALLFNNNKNGGDTNGIKIINKNTKYFISNRFGEYILEYFYKKLYPVYAIPYDFRIIPQINYLKNLRESIKLSIEEIYKENNKKVVVIAHSLGSIVIMNFFNNIDTKWINKYIDLVICINPPFEGSILALRTLLESSLTFFFKNIKLNFIRNFGGLIWCLPDINHNTDFLNIDGKDITNIENVLYPETLEIYKKYFKNNDNYDKKKINKNLNLHIIKSYGINTPIKLYLNSSQYGYKFNKYDYMDGDGIIINNINTNNFNIHRIVGEHSNILESNDLLNKINEIIK